MSEGYNPTNEEVEKAEGAMTPEQILSTKDRLMEANKEIGEEITRIENHRQKMIDFVKRMNEKFDNTGIAVTDNLDRAIENLKSFTQENTEWIEKHS